jgi:anti-sigma-K factor RskA
MTDRAETPDDFAERAAQYVLGHLEGTELAAFEAELAANPQMRLAVALERERFLELDVAAPPATPSADLWSRIEAKIGTSAEPVDLAAHRTAKQKRLPARPPRGGFWRGFAAACVLSTFVAGMAWNLVRTPAPRLVVVLLDAQAKPVSIVEAFPGQRVRIVPLVDIDVPAGRVLQVWTLPDPATGPVSIGLMPSVSATTLDGPVLPPPQQDQLYEITLEPSGGSPTGRPTGPIVGKGFASQPRI